MARWGETGRERRCLRRISAAVSCEAASVAASLVCLSACDPRHMENCCCGGRCYCRRCWHQSPNKCCLRQTHYSILLLWSAHLAVQLHWMRFGGLRWETAERTYLFWRVRPAGWILKLGATARRRPSWNTRWEAIVVYTRVGRVVEDTLGVVVLVLNVSMSSCLPSLLRLPRSLPPPISFLAYSTTEYGRARQQPVKSSHASRLAFSSSRTSLSPTLSLRAEGVGVTSHLFAAVMVVDWDLRDRRETPVVNHSYCLNNNLTSFISRQHTM